MTTFHLGGDKNGCVGCAELVRPDDTTLICKSEIEGHDPWDCAGINIDYDPTVDPSIFDHDPEECYA